MKDPVIVYTRGLWAHPDAVKWIIQNVQNATGLEVIDYDYSNGLIQNVDNETYLKRVTEKFGDEIISQNRDVIFMGHSHGAALGIVFNKVYGFKKMITSAPGIRPFGVFRRIPNALKKDYVPHYIVKTPGEVEIRKDYFSENFDLWRDFSRVFYVGTEAKKSIDAIKKDILFIQGTSDEFVNVGTNLKLYNEIYLPEYHIEQTPKLIGPTKQLILVPDGEHAILEEIGNKGKENEYHIYKDLFDAVGKFTRR